MNITLQGLSPNKIYHLLTQAIIPRPIAWVLSQNESSADTVSHNLAPFSYFTPVASNPPLLMVSIGKKSNADDKDTVVNIRRETFCTVHIASVEHMSLLNASAKEMALNESEVDALDVPLVPFSEGDSLMRLRDAPVAFKCKLHEMQSLVKDVQTLVFLEVLDVFISDEVIDTEQSRLTLKADKIDPLTRLGAGEYASIGDVVSLLRP